MKAKGGGGKMERKIIKGRKHPNTLTHCRQHDLGSLKEAKGRGGARKVGAQVNVKETTGLLSGGPEKIGGKKAGLHRKKR